jgi:hypothetical protein
MKIKVIFLSIITSLFGCNVKPPETMLVDLTNFQATDGFVDIPLTIISTTEVDEYYEYEVSAKLNKDTIGLIVQLKKEIPAGFVNGEPKSLFLTDGIKFLSKGQNSDQLLQFMATKYKIQSEGLEMKQKQTFTCANLNETEIDFKNGSARFKIFLETEEEYAELFVNFDFAQQMIYLNEKDEEYRAGLVALLKKKNHDKNNSNPIANWSLCKLR